MNKKLKFFYDYYKWCIHFKCKCGEVLYMDENSERFIVCKECKRRYTFDEKKDRLKEVKI